MTHTPSLSGPIFKFSRETNAVRVENIPQNANRLEVLALFSTLIGDIRASQDSDDAMEITFFTADAARYVALVSEFSSISGSSLLVSSIVRAASPAPSHGSQQGRRADTRRNLYVLGVPFGMTNQSLAALFIPYGTVSHCVILATLDSASRRRGFVVMSTHEEARQAMAALGRSSKGGSGMDISWAVVQRSKGLFIYFSVPQTLTQLSGFLDGGDRAGIVHPPAASLSSPSTRTRKRCESFTCLPSSGSFLSSAPLSTSTPVPPAPVTAAIVHYASFAAAQDAHRALDGELYAGFKVRAAYLVEHETEPASAPESSPSANAYLPLPAQLPPTSPLVLCSCTSLRAPRAR
ncbi:RRM domain-containing protein [Mycena venus]|uniref:RRM domain-containing protein n=1 Tax=Mycena venus TaxID=2733690 RepID=A0A8H6YK56_9AGAR|nr:RRM domain-containing protein [Mycena venus]